MIYPFVNDSRSQVGLTTATGTTQNQPALRFCGEFPGSLVSPAEFLLTGRVTAFPLRLQIFEV